MDMAKDCMICGKEIGHRGFCPDKCQDEYYDSLSQKDETEKIVLSPTEETIIIPKKERGKGGMKLYKKNDWDVFWKTKHKLISIFRTYFDNQYISMLKKITRLTGKILETGSGTAYCSSKIADETDAKVYALDYSKTTRKYWINKKVNYVLADAFNTKFDDNMFDLVWNAGLLEHFEDDKQIKMLKEMKRITKIGGIVCIFVPSILDITAQLQIYGKENVYSKTKLESHLKLIGLSNVKSKIMFKTLGMFIVGWGINDGDYNHNGLKEKKSLLKTLKVVFGVGR